MPQEALLLSPAIPRKRIFSFLLVCWFCFAVSPAFCLLGFRLLAAVWTALTSSVLSLPALIAVSQVVPSTDSFLEKIETGCRVFARLLDEIDEDMRSAADKPT